MLRDKGLQFEEVDLNRGISIEDLDKLIGARDYLQFLNPRNELYRERNMKQNPPPRDEALRLMAQHPNLIRRPIAVEGRHIGLGYEGVAEML